MNGLYQEIKLVNFVGFRAPMSPCPTNFQKPFHPAINRINLHHTAKFHPVIMNCLASNAEIVKNGNDSDEDVGVAAE
jgi:hypothetical protein